MSENRNREDSLLAKAGYGLADIYGGGAFVVISTFYTVFLTKAEGLPVALAGTIPLIGKIWDAVTDPVMGNIADRTRSRFGAKRFYLLLGSFISAITFVCMWIPFGSSVNAKFAFYTCMYMLFSTGFTIVMVPYNGLLPDMVDDYQKRASFTGVRMIFSTFGAILAGLIPTLMIRDNTNGALYLQVGIIFAVIFLVVILLTFALTWEKQKEPVTLPVSESFKQSFSVYRSRAFRYFVAVFLAGQAAADFFTGLAVYYVDDVLNAYGGGRFTYMMAALLVAQFLGTIGFSFFIEKKGKEFPLLVSFPIRVLATAALLFFSYEGAPFIVVLVLSFFIGISMSGTSTTIYALLADLADVDELITGISRPATVSAMATFVRKIATGFSSACIGLLLAMAGYDEVIASSGGRQSAFTQKGIAVIFVFVPILLMTLAFICTKKYPVKKKEYDVVRKEVARRKGEDDSDTSEEEKRICEKVTGISYDDLYNNAVITGGNRK